MSRRRNLLLTGAAAGALGGGVALARALRPGGSLLPRPESRPIPTPLSGTESFHQAGDGARLRLVEAGRGRPLVLLHGVTLAAEVWHKQFDDLSGSFRVIALDQRGHGASVAGEEPASLPRLATDLAELLEALDLRDAVLVSHSMGGMVCLALAEAHPELFGSRVGALMLMSTSAGPLIPLPGLVTTQVISRTESSARLVLNWAERRHLHEPVMGGPLGAAVVERLVFGRQPEASDVELTRLLAARTPPGLFAELWSTMPGLDLRHAYASVRVPTTVMVGLRDRVTPPRLARAMAAGLGGCPLVEVGGAGHMLMLERPRAVREAIVDLASRSC